MKRINLTLITIAFVFLLSLNFIAPISVDADYITIYSGEEGKITLKMDNNEDFDVKRVSISLDLDKLPFTTVGSSEKDIDDIDENDDDSVSFTLRASSDIEPGDYDIQYTLKYSNADSIDEESYTKEGTFGLRVSAKTDLDFSVETRGKEINSPIVGKEGRISLEVINRGLAEIKSVNVKITPEGYELLSKNNVFVGTIDSDDTDLASFEVIYRSISPKFKADVTYKDFDNKDQTKSVDILFKVYSEEQALKLGLIKKSKIFVYFIILVVLIVAWFVLRRMRKNKKKNWR